MNNILAGGKTLLGIKAIQWSLSYDQIVYIKEDKNKVPFLSDECSEDDVILAKYFGGERVFI